MELNIEKWKATINDLGETAFNAYFINDIEQNWNKLSHQIREKWILVGIALAEKLCPHDDKFVSDTRRIWCNTCGLELNTLAEREKL